MIAYDHQQIETNGIKLHVVQAGPQDGPLVILLHGFPEFWYGWKTQMDFLAERGFRVWTPDQRGYNLSDKPEGIAAYNLDILADDVVGLIDATGQEKVFLAGHDWGAAAAWWLAMKYPQRLKKLCVVSAPHPSVFQRYLRSNFKQFRKSLYWFFFQIPRLPEFLSSRNDAAATLRSMKSSSRPGTFSDEDQARYREAWAQPGAWTAMLNWYRASIQAQPARLQDSRVHVPTLMIWGTSDSFIAKETAQLSIERCDEGELVMIDNAGHWILHEEPVQTSELIFDIFQNEAISSSVPGSR
jgi:pimeloyl-ACP methyl ester carboxylesterase